MKLSTRLYLLVAGTIIPLVGLAVMLGALLLEHERDNFRRLATDRNRAFMSAVDAELRGHISTLYALSANSSLQRRDLRGFHAEAVDALRTQRDWENVILSEPGGRELLVGVRAYGDLLPEDPDPESLLRAVGQVRPEIGNVRRWESIGRWAIPVRVPVIQQGQVAYVLTAVVAPRQFEQMILAQNLPPDWVSGLVDATGQFIARVPPRPNSDKASAQFMTQVRNAPEGWYRGSTVDGLDSYTAHITSRSSRWSLGFAVPAELVHASARRFGWGLALGTLLTLALALGFAVWMGRRISVPIAGLAANARGLGRSERLPLLDHHGIEEVHALERALDAADTAMREREALRQSEQAALRAADRSKDEFLAMLGHELRNPLSAIMTSSHVLRSAPEGSRMSAQARVIIERQARHMTRLIDDLLDVSRLTMGKVELHREVLDLAALVRTLVATWEASGRVGAGRIRVQAQTAWVDADRTRVEQIAANLLDNANRFTPPGRHVDVVVSRQAGEVELRVVDQGHGIAPDMLGRIFQRFTQAPQGPERAHGGLGLGLAVVRQLVELHGGSVGAESAGEGQGATFTVRLPAADAPEATQAEAPNPAGQALPLALRVLVVEDGEDARAMLEAMLGLHGHEVRTAADGRSGLEEAIRFRPHVVLLDIGLPDIEGYEVARRLRADDATRGARIVALTGYGQTEDEARAYAAGFDLHVTKPVEPDALARMLAGIGASMR